MRLIVGIFILGICLVGCSNFEKEQLHGHWKNDTWEFKFRPDNTCMMSNNKVVQGENLKYRTFGNTLEISRDGKVIISGLTIKGIENDQLTLEFRNLVGSGDQMEEIQVLNKQ